MMKRLFLQGNQLVVFDWANVVARAFSVENEVNSFLILLLYMLAKYRKLFNNYEFIFALEGNGRSRRQALFPEYKFGRHRFTDNFEIVHHKSLELLHFLGGKIIHAPEGEADDAIASYINKKTSSADTICVVSEDKDLWQLVRDPFVTVYSDRNKLRLDEGAVFEKTKGVLPSSIRMWKTLLGDSSDNISGVARLRKKSAMRLSNQYPNLNQLIKYYKNADFLSKFEVNQIEHCKGILEVNYDLVGLRSNLALVIKNKKPKPNKLNKFLVEMNVFEFNKEQLQQITGLT